MAESNKGQPYEKIPTLSPQTIQWIDEHFPVVEPELTDSERQIFFRVGQRSVVEYLKAVLREQQGNIMEL